VDPRRFRICGFGKVLNLWIQEGSEFVDPDLCFYGHPFFNIYNFILRFFSIFECKCSSGI